MNLKNYIDETTKLIQIQRLKRGKIYFPKNYFNKFIILIDKPNDKTEKRFIDHIQKKNKKITFLIYKNIKWSLTEILSNINLYLSFNSKFLLDFFSQFGIFYNFYTDYNLTLIERYKKLIFENEKALCEWLKIEKKQLLNFTVEEFIYFLYKDTLSKKYINDLINSNKKGLDLNIMLIDLFSNNKNFYYKFVELKLTVLSFKYKSLKFNNTKEDNFYEKNFFNIMDLKSQ